MLALAAAAVLTNTVGMADAQTRSDEPLVHELGPEPRPGPDVLYAQAPVVPELEVTPPFVADPLLVSGTDALCDGEYLYQDHLFDDHGANTQPSLPSNEGPFGIFPPAGDVTYPEGEIYADNAADLVEVRIRPLVDAVAYRITLNTLLDASVPLVVLGVDRDRAGPPAAWPAGAGLTTDGIDTFVVVTSDGARVTTPDVSETVPVQVDLDRNQLTFTVPRTIADPGTDTWTYVAGVGVREGDGMRPVDGAPAVHNLAFRFDESQSLLGSDTVLATGNWFEEGQAETLSGGTTGGYEAEVDFGALAAGIDGCEWIHAPGRDQARVMGSRLDVPEGVHEGPAPNFGGRLQPYLLHLPEPSREPPGVVLALHGNTATYTQWAAVSPNYLDQVGRQRNRVVISPLGRSTQSAGVEFDMFEAWNDAARHVELDMDRAVISGYSAGGYMTYAIGLKYPDLFGGAFSIVGAGRLLQGGPPGDHTNMLPFVGNARWVPFVAWNQAVDELAPYPAILLTHGEFNSRGLRNELFTLPAGEHFTPGLLDQWVGAADYLGDAEVVRAPHRVDLGIAPELWEMLAPAYGTDTTFPDAHLVADHAYWLADLRTRDEVRDETGTIRGYASAVSHAFGVGDAPGVPTVSAYAGPPQPATVHGTAWGDVPTVAPRNALDVELTNLRQATIWGERARLSPTEPLTVAVTSDGNASLHVVLPYADGARVEVVSGAADRSASSVDSSGVTLRAGAGTTVFEISPDGAPGPTTDAPPAADTSAGPTPDPVDTGAPLPATGGGAVVAAALLLLSAHSTRRPGSRA